MCIDIISLLNVATFILTNIATTQSSRHLKGMQARIKGTIASDKRLAKVGIARAKDPRRQIVRFVLLSEKGQQSDHSYGLQKGKTAGKTERPQKQPSQSERLIIFLIVHGKGSTHATASSRKPTKRQV